MCAIVALLETRGSGITSKVRFGCARSSGVRSRKPRIMPSWPSLNRSSAERLRSARSLKVSAGSRTISSSFSMAPADAALGQRQRWSACVGVVDDLATARPDERRDLLEVGRDVEPADARPARLRGRPAEVVERPADRPG